MSDFQEFAGRRSWVFSLLTGRLSTRLLLLALVTGFILAPGTQAQTTVVRKTQTIQTQTVVVRNQRPQPANNPYYYKKKSGNKKTTYYRDAWGNQTYQTKDKSGKSKTVVMNRRGEVVYVSKKKK